MISFVIFRAKVKNRKFEGPNLNGVQNRKFQLIWNMTWQQVELFKTKVLRNMFFFFLLLLLLTECIVNLEETLEQKLYIFFPWYMRPKKTKRKKKSKFCCFLFQQKKKKKKVILFFSHKEAWLFYSFTFAKLSDVKIYTLYNIVSRNNLKEKKFHILWP